MPTTLITGATGGIGRALARQLSGHDLILTGRDPARLAEVEAEFPEARVLALDLMRPETFAAGLSDISELDHLVHSAGVITLGKVGEQPVQVWQDTLAVNLISPAELTRLLLPQLRHSRGLVVFVNSGAGLSASPQWGSYAASKFGLRALADSLRAEEATHGIRVCSVFPGRTATDMQRQVREQEGGEFLPQQYLSAETVAHTIRFVLESPPDVQLGELTLRSGGR